MNDFDPAHTRIAFLGLGSMGTRMASRLAHHHFDLKVWSRSGVSAPSLRPFQAASPAEAARDADIVLAMVTDDPASEAVWLDPNEGALGAMRRGAVAVECSTLSPRWVSTLAGRAHDAGIAMLDAPVVGSRPQAEAGALVFLVGGDVSVVERVKPVLLRMGREVHPMGATPAGVTTKLIANTLLAVQMASLAELLGFAEKSALDRGALMRALEGLPVMSPSATGAAAGMLARRFEPMFPITLATKDLRYLESAAKSVGSTLPIATSASDVLERGRAQGLGEENLTAVAKLYAAS